MCGGAPGCGMNLYTHCHQHCSAAVTAARLTHADAPGCQQARAEDAAAQAAQGRPFCSAGSDCGQGIEAVNCLP
eukprot:363384-Chlamydomonas_euryale.AAC.19